MTVAESSGEARARFAIESLLASGLKVQFGFDVDKSIELWAVPLGAFTMTDVTAGIGKWVMTESEMPTLEKFIRTIQAIVRQRQEDERPLDGMCPECGEPAGETSKGERVPGVMRSHWVRVIDGVDQVETFKSKQHRAKKPDADPVFIEVERHHYRPCSLCMPERYSLYARGHFDEGHDPCPACRKYRIPGLRDSA